jgi:hypothetical protein
VKHTISDILPRTFIALNSFQLNFNPNNCLESRYSTFTMSVGASPSDFVMFIEGIGWLVGVLRKDTLNGFERLAMTYAIFKERA